MLHFFLQNAVGFHSDSWVQAAVEAAPMQTQRSKGMEQDESCCCQKWRRWGVDSGRRGLAGDEGTMLSTLPYNPTSPGTWLATCMGSIPHPCMGASKLLCCSWQRLRAVGAADLAALQGPLTLSHYLFLQGCHPLLEVQLQPLVGFAQQPIHRV